MGEPRRVKLGPKYCLLTLIVGALKLALMGAGTVKFVEVVL